MTLLDVRREQSAVKVFVVSLANSPYFVQSIKINAVNTFKNFYVFYSGIALATLIAYNVEHHRTPVSTTIFPDTMFPLITNWHGCWLEIKSSIACRMKRDTGTPVSSDIARSESSGPPEMLMSILLID